MKFLYLYFLSLFFIFNANVNASTNFEKISNDFELIYNSWNHGEFNKYEDIFRRDNENAFNTCVAVKCGSSLLEHYNRVLYSLQNATGEKKGMFGKKFTYEEYQNYKNIYFEQKESSAEAIKNTRGFLNKLDTSLLELNDFCETSLTDIENDDLNNKKNNKDKTCNDIFIQTEKNLKVFQLELSNFRTLLDYSLNENHNNSLKKSSKLLISYNGKILSIIEQGIINLKNQVKIIASLEEDLLRKNKNEKNSSLFNIRFLSNKKKYKEIVLDKDRHDPTVDFFYENFDKLKVSVFRYEFQPETKNDVFERYYFYTYKIIDKNDNPEPIVKIVAFSKEIYENEKSCERARYNIINEYKNQKGISKFFTVSDPYNNEYRFSIRSRTCSSSIFSSKFSFNLAVGIDRVDRYNSHALLNLMGYNFKGNNNALEKNEVKF
jgi:hypothetical protein